jgi:hypothetical protein
MVDFLSGKAVVPTSGDEDGWLASGVLPFHRLELLFGEATQAIMAFVGREST